MITFSYTHDINIDSRMIVIWCAATHGRIYPIPYVLIWLKRRKVNQHKL